MRFRVLGSVRALKGDAEVAIPGERVRTLLAALLLRPGQLVGADTLLYDVWGEELPSNPRSALQAAVSRLRSALRIELRHEPGGYRIDLQRHELDLLQFRDNLTAAADADPERRVELLTAALRWHEGDVLRGASTGTLAQRFGPGLRDQWLAAREQRAEARLQLGQVDDALAELTAVTTGSPLREQAWSLLLKALHQAGRPAEALAAYDKIRRLLAEELGTGPSPGLRDMHQVLLAADRAATWIVRTRLPLPVSGFIGRDDEVAKSLDLLTHDDGLPVLVLSGLAGVGKTALAVRIGHSAKDLFTDGQWLVRLRGRPMDDILVELLGFCGIASDAVPSDAPSRLELFRETLAGRRVLLILDDATSAAEVQAVLPNAAGCAVIVTSRRSLGELAVTAGASGTVLQPLSLVESTAFLRRTLPAADKAVVDDLAGLCAGLPLALRVAAAGGRTLPAGRLTSYVGRLRRDRLAYLSQSVGGQGVRASFDLSYDALPDRLRRLFALLGVHPGDDFGPGVAAALVGADPATAATELDELAEAGLLIRTDLDRYTLHDLVREYAAGLPVDDAEPAVRRMLDWYLYSAVSATEALHDRDVARYLDPITPGVRPARAVSERDAYEWFDAEWGNLASVVLSCHSWQLAGVMAPYVRDRRRWQDHRDLYRFAVDAADRTDGKVWVLGCLGSMQLYCRDLSGAEDTFRAMRDLSRTLHDRQGEADAIRGLGMVSHWRDDHGSAAEFYRCSLILDNVPIGRAQTLNNLADCLFRLDALDPALDAATESVRTYREIGNRQGTALARGTLAEICLASGDLDGASRQLTRCLVIARDLGALVLEAEATATLALVHEAADDREQAHHEACRAVELLRGTGANPFVSRVAHLT